MNARGMFTLDEKQLLAPQLMENVERANEIARMEQEGFIQQLERDVVLQQQEWSDEDQSQDALK